MFFEKFDYNKKTKTYIYLKIQKMFKACLLSLKGTKYQIRKKDEIKCNESSLDSRQTFSRVFLKISRNICQKMGFRFDNNR